MDDSAAQLGRGMSGAVALHVTSPRGSWLALAVILAIAAPPLLAGLGRRDSTHTMENVALVTSQETWFRLHEGDRSALLMTSNDGAPRIEKPPMLTWINFLAWSDLDPRQAAPTQLLFRARLAAVALGLLTLAAIFRIGHCVGGRNVAIMATLAAASTWFFQRQARTASYDIHFVSWTALATAGALWAIAAPAAGALPRQLLGWFMCTVALASSVFSKNPLPVALVSIPIITAIMLRSRQAARNFAWFVAALCVVGLLFGSWYIFALSKVSDPLGRIGTEFTQPRGDDAQPFWYYLGLAGLMLPWSVWLAGGLALPFDRRARPDRRRILMPWIWFILIFIGFSIPPAKQQRYILAIVPAAVILVAMLLDLEQRRCERGGRPHPLLLWPHWLALVVVSPCLGPFLAAQDWFIERGWLADRVAAPISWPLAIGLAIVLSMVALAGLALHRRGRVIRGGVCTAAWAIIATTVFWHAYAGAPSAVHPLREPTEALAAELGHAPLGSLRLAEDRGRVKLNEEFRFYLGRPIRRLAPEELEPFAAQAGGPAFVLTRTSAEHARLMHAAGYREVRRVDVDDGRQLRLWVAETQRSPAPHDPPGSP
jgi:4-amino-4-deoxy-L-arabinose transferase-like glycosyltransferase